MYGIGWNTHYRVPVLIIAREGTAEPVRLFFTARLWSRAVSLAASSVATKPASQRRCANSVAPDAALVRTIDRPLANRGLHNARWRTSSQARSELLHYPWSPPCAGWIPLARSSAASRCHTGIVHRPARGQHPARRELRPSPAVKL